MEGPSLFLAAEQLQPFVGKKILTISGNTKIGKERMSAKKVLDIFAWGKHLVFQFDDFALRVHFMLFGSFRAKVAGQSVTGDYKVKNQEPRLVLKFKNGEIEMFSCSLKFVESDNAKADYDYSIDVMSPQWDASKAVKELSEDRKREIADVLLDQTIFAGVGNIIKNEVLFLAKVRPATLIGKLSQAKLKQITKFAQSFSQQFLEWRRIFMLRKNLQIYRKGACPSCRGKVVRGKTGLGQRWSYYCPVCQK